MQKEVLQTLIKSACYAPSGDNSQPWQFHIENNVITILLVRNADETLYNSKERGSILAHGALMENIQVTANYLGLKIDIDEFPAGFESDVTATVKVLSEGTGSRSKEYYHSIFTRHTNRLRYKSASLPEGLSDELASFKDNHYGLEVKFVSDITLQNQIGLAVAYNEKLLLENKPLHDKFFKQIVWTEAEERTVKRGLYFKTFGLKGPPSLIFKLLPNWGFAQFLGKIGFGQLIAVQNSKVWSSGSTHIGIVVKDDHPSTWISVGRLMQQLWLWAESRGLSMQPLAGVIFLNWLIKDSGGKEFSIKQVRNLDTKLAIIKEAFEIGNGELGMCMRLGFTKKLAIKSSKKDPVII